MCLCNLIFFGFYFFLESVVVVLVIVRYVQEALKFKLHFNSRLNAEATCEKMSPYVWRMAGDRVVGVVVVDTDDDDVFVAACNGASLDAVASAEIALPFTQPVECVELALSTVHTKCTCSVRFKR